MSDTDKRSMATDALKTLGTIIGDTEGRDAIHLAVEPVVAAVALEPGQHIGFVPGGVGPSDQNVGIVDPFLTHIVLPGSKFWMVVYPRTITSLRHVWSHPLIPDVEDRHKAEQMAEALDGSHRNWIRGYAERLGMSYDTLMDGARDFVKFGHDLNLGGLLEGESTDPEFWDHYERVSGEKVDASKRESFFTCSC